MLVHPDLVEVFGSNESLDKFFTLIKALLVMFIVIVFIWNYVVMITQEEWAFINFMQQRGSEHRRSVFGAINNQSDERIMYAYIVFLITQAFFGERKLKFCAKLC